jgi:hypothetical protein
MAAAPTAAPSRKGPQVERLVLRFIAISPYGCE